MASINQSLGILRASGLASAESYAVKNAIEIIKQLFGVELDVDVFLEELRFPAICQQAGVIGGLLPELNGGVVEYQFHPLIKPAFKLVSVSLETPREGAKYVALNFIGTLPYADEDVKEGEESTVKLPNLLVTGKVYSAVNSAWEFESETAADVFLAPEFIPTIDCDYQITRLSANSKGGGFVELAGTSCFRTSEEKFKLLSLSAMITVEKGVCKLGQEVVSSGMSSNLLNFQYYVGQTFIAANIQKLGKTSYKFKSGEVEYWVPASMKKTFAATAPAIPEMCLCEVVGENEKDGKKYPKVAVVHKNTDSKYELKLEKAEILVPLAA